MATKRKAAKKAVIKRTSAKKAPKKKTAATKKKVTRAGDTVIRKPQ